MTYSHFQTINLELLDSDLIVLRQLTFKKQTIRFCVNQLEMIMKIVVQLALKKQIQSALHLGQVKSLENNFVWSNCGYINHINTHTKM